MTGVFEQYKKGVFGVHKGVVFRTVLKRTWAGFWTSWRVVFGVHKKGLFSDTLEGGIVLSIERIEKKERPYPHAQNKNRFKSKLKP